MSDKLLSRTSNVVIQELTDEILIYDLSTYKAYCLNATSAMVWRLCDGNTISEIQGKISEQLGELVSEDFVRLALLQLKNEGLLESSRTIDNQLNGLSRRSAIRKLGFTSMVALPMISVLLTPSATMAQSILANGTACTSDPQCASGNCFNSDLTGLTCCVATVDTVGLSPTNGLGCVLNQSECDTEALAQCCNTGTGTLMVNGCSAPAPGSGFCVCD